MKYHLENLLAAGLVEISNTRWSEKGREMKIYAVKDQVVVFAPRKTADVKGIVERYGTIAGVVAIGCSLILTIPQTLSQVAQHTDMMKTSMFAAIDAPNAVTGTGSYLPIIHNVVQGFLVVALALLALMMAYELYITKKNG